MEASLRTFVKRYNLSAPKRSGSFVLIVILFISLILRLWNLEIKPTHFDEGINGHFVAKMWKEGFYRYNPSNFHGPLYFYFLQLSEVLFGRSIFAYRAVTGLISVGIVAVIGMHRRFFGSAALWAAAVIAVSPAFVFYSRYAIHESLFILLQVLFCYGFFLWREERSRTAVALMVFGFFGTFTVKETFFIFFGTWLIAMGVAKFFAQIANQRSQKMAGVRSTQAEESITSHTLHKTPQSTDSQWLDIASICFLGALLAVILFTGFFMNMTGFGDMLRAFAFWSKTGVGASGHEKPFMYWIDLLRRYEWPILLGLVLSPFVFFRSGHSARILILTGFGTWLAYSLIPYKTPWLILNMIWPLAFVVGFLVARDDSGKKGQANRIVSLRPLLQAVVAVLILWSAAVMLRLNFRDYAKESEPYVYVQSTMEYKAVMDIIAERARRHPEDHNLRIAVLNKDSWPMPWDLLDYPNTFYGKPETAPVENADVILVDRSKRHILEPRLRGRYWVLPFKIRGSYENGFAFLKFDKFQNLVAPTGEVFNSSSDAGQTEAAP